MSSPSESQPAARRGEHSLRTELLAAQLAVLLLVVLGFGGAIYALVAQAVYRQAEADLFGAAQLIAQDLESGDSPGSLAISRTYWHRFGPAPRDRAYFAIWDSQGKLLAGSDELPSFTHPGEELPPAKGPRPYLSEREGRDLMVTVRGSGNRQILVGRPLGREGDYLRRLLLTVSLVGLASLLVGAAAAWWLARRIARPLETLTQTAEKISVRHLEERLPVVPAAAELGTLTLVFNRMLERLQNSFERQTRFTADASHEIRTPVAVVLTQAEHTLSRPRSEEEYREALQTCLRAARRMKCLADDLLLLARADSGRLEQRRETSDLADLVRGAVSLLEPLAREEQVELTAELVPTSIVCDPAQLTQVVTNLMTNGIRYNRPGGKVIVDVRAEQGRARLRVSDTGIGIAAEDQPRVFDRFFRADPARTHTAGQGTGLGLCIVAEIVAAHGGSVQVTSTPGEGTTFTVELPLAETPGKPAAEPPATASSTQEQE